jgi:hypoxanthine phosphoribosyltransferase
MKTVFNRGYIKQQIKEVASQIDAYYKESPFGLLSVPVLNGGVYFYVDLMRELTITTEMGVVSTHHYGEAEVPFENVQFRYQEAEVENRHVLLVDEICFTGKTLKAIKDRFLRQGAKDVKSVVLVDHLKDNRVYAPDWGVVPYRGDGWLWGWGMDRNGLFREREEIVE